MLSYVKVVANAENVEKSFYKKHFSQFKPCIKKPAVSFADLSDEQQKIVQDIRGLISRPVQEQISARKLIIINAEGGMGKSVVARHIMYTLQCKKRTDSSFDFLAMAFSGTAAENIQAVTIHSAFHIPTYVKPTSLQFQLAKKIDPKFAKSLRKIRVLVLDEFSFVGLRLFSYIDQLCRRCDQDNEHLPFSGKIVILIGDPAQLSPIKDYPLCAKEFGNAFDKELLQAAAAVFQQFDTVYRLNKSYRQQGQAEFIGLLKRLRHGIPSQGDIALIRSRLQSQLSQREVDSFKDAIRVFPYNRDVNDYNLQQLGERFPLAQITSQPNGLNGEMLTICIGADVSLCRNICVALGLVNSSRGKVVDIIFQPGGNKIKFVLVHFPDYSGHVICRSRRGDGIPIFPFRNTELHDGRLRTYTSIPLCLRFSMTGHKSQGKTYEQIAIQLGTRMPFPGYDYLLMSRVRDPYSILILDESIKDDRFQYRTGQDLNFFKMNAEEEERLDFLAAVKDY